MGEKVTSRNAKHLRIIKHRRRRETPWHRIKKTLAETKKLGEVGGVGEVPNHVRVCHPA